VAAEAANHAFIEALNGKGATDFGQVCADCRMTLNQIEALTGKRSMFVADKDGVKALLCKFCLDKFNQKALDNGTFRGYHRNLSTDEFRAKFYRPQYVRLANRALIGINRAVKKALGR
jgi:hypothetical protein